MDADERGPPRRFPRQRHRDTEKTGAPGISSPLLSSGSTAQNHAGPAYLLRKIGSRPGIAWITPRPSVFRREWTQMNVGLQDDSTTEAQRHGENRCAWDFFHPIAKQWI